MASESRYREWRETEHGNSVFWNAVDVCRRIKRRKARFSIAGVVSVVRFDRIVQGGNPDDFKVNNTWNPLLAREIMDKVPELSGFFDVREMPALKP